MHENVLHHVLAYFACLFLSAFVESPILQNKENARSLQTKLLDTHEDPVQEGFREMRELREN